ncbi:MAG: sigma factor-like helix-turn-helix DNA-binding protein [Acidimicrobiales bacterium]
MERPADGSEPGTRIAVQDAVRAALGALPVQQRAAVILIDGEGFDYNGAAQVLGVPRGTVASRVAGPGEPFAPTWRPCRGRSGEQPPRPHRRRCAGAGADPPGAPPVLGRPRPSPPGRGPPSPLPVPRPPRGGAPAMWPPAGGSEIPPCLWSPLPAASHQANGPRRARRRCRGGGRPRGGDHLA